MASTGFESISLACSKEPRESIGSMVGRSKTLVLVGGVEYPGGTSTFEGMFGEKVVPRSRESQNPPQLVNSKKERKHSEIKKDWVLNNPIKITGAKGIR